MIWHWLGVRRMIWRALLLALFLATPAYALQIESPTLNCGGLTLAPGATVTDVGCGGQGLWLVARATGYPVTEAPVIHFTLTVDGALTGERTLALPVTLPACFLCDGPYTGLVLGWQLPLACAEGCTGAAIASVAQVGGSDPDVPFTLDVPTPEPASLLLLGSVLALIGWRVRR